MRRASKTATKTASKYAMQVFFASTILASRTSCLVCCVSIPVSRAARNLDRSWCRHSWSLCAKAISDTNMAWQMQTQ